MDMPRRPGRNIICPTCIPLGGHLQIFSTDCTIQALLHMVYMRKIICAHYHRMASALADLPLEFAAMFLPLHLSCQQHRVPKVLSLLYIRTI